MRRVALLPRPSARVGLLRGFATASKPLHMVFGASSIPHPDKALKGGEDAFFSDDSVGAFGVADGVGGSATKKVDPGLFSRELLRRCHSALGQPPDAKISHALQAASAEKLTLGGSSTLLLGQLETSTHVLRLLNLGDSGAMLLRPSVRRFPSGSFLWPRAVLRSIEQTHAFNTPYQVGARDFAHAAMQMDELCTVVQEGDVLVAATDGVLDNLFDQTIQVTVAKCLDRLRATEPRAVQAAVDELAGEIAREANAVGLKQDDKDVRTPFEAAAASEGFQFLGGKLDDVAVVCGVVCSGERPPSRVLSNFETTAAA